MNVMIKLDNKELNNIYAGTLSGTLVNAFTRLFEFIYEIGKSAGSAIRRKKDGNYCSINCETN